jgi:hypothetical protein
MSLVIVNLKGQGKLNKNKWISKNIVHIFLLLNENWYYRSIRSVNITWSPLSKAVFYTAPPPPPGGRGGVYCLTSVRPSFQDIFLSNYRWQKSDIWSQASYRYPFLDPSDSYFLFADLVGFYTHWTCLRGYHKRALAHSSSCFF